MLIIRLPLPATRSHNTQNLFALAQPVIIKINKPQARTSRRFLTRHCRPHGQIRYRTFYVICSIVYQWVVLARRKKRDGKWCLQLGWDTNRSRNLNVGILWVAAIRHGQLLLIPAACNNFSRREDGDMYNGPGTTFGIYRVREVGQMAALLNGGLSDLRNRKYSFCNICPPFTWSKLHL
jgi:hypothetical protein